MISLFAREYRRPTRPLTEVSNTKHLDIDAIWGPFVRQVRSSLIDHRCIVSIRLQQRSDRDFQKTHRIEQDRFGLMAPFLFATRHGGYCA
jgi:hypothetical protein